MTTGFWPYAVPSQLLERIYCPTCSRPMAPRETVDPLIHGTVCPSGHRYFIPRGAVTAQAGAKAAALSSVGSGNLKFVANEWLRRSEYRYFLTDQIAWALRRVYEIELLNERVRPARDPFKYCAVCAALLSDSGSREGGYASGRTCVSGHDFAIHSYSATFDYLEQQVHLEGELSDQNTVYLANVWATSDKPELRGMVHEDLRRIFAAFVGGSGESLG